MRHRERSGGPASPLPRATVFLDRDGVINRRLEGSYVRSWSEFEFLPGVTEALRRLAQAGYRLVVVTNQRGVARGQMSDADLSLIHDRMLEEARLAGGPIAAVYYCPHEMGECRCRKPDTGLFLEARRDFPDIDFPTSTVIGDSPSDMEAGLRLGCRTVFIGERERMPCAPTLYEAVDRLLESPASLSPPGANDRPPVRES